MKRKYKSILVVNGEKLEFKSNISRGFYIKENDIKAAYCYMEEIETGLICEGTQYNIRG